MAVDHRVVGHDGVGWIEAELSEEGEGTLEGAHVRRNVLAGVQLDVGDSRVVVDDAVEVVIAGATRPHLLAAAVDAVASNSEAREPLDVEMQERPWP